MHIRTLQRWLHRLGIVALVLLLGGGFALFVGIMRGERWARQVVGKARADSVQYAVWRFGSKYFPRDTDRDGASDFGEMLRLHHPLDYYNGLEYMFTLHDGTRRREGFCYAGATVDLYLWLHVGFKGEGMPAPGTTLTIDAPGGRLAYNRNKSDLRLSEGLKDRDARDNWVRYYYHAPDEPGREVTLTARLRGPRDFDGSYKVNILGHPGTPVRVREATESGEFAIGWDGIPGEHAGLAVEYYPGTGGWMIWADLPPDATRCTIAQLKLDPNNRDALERYLFRIVPYTR